MNGRSSANKRKNQILYLCPNQYDIHILNLSVWMGKRNTYGTCTLHQDTSRTDEHITAICILQDIQTSLVP